MADILDSTPLLRYGRPASSVFDLLGHREVDLTAAFGWTLANSPILLAAFTDALGFAVDPGEVAVALETADEEGRTDIELTATDWRVVIEAKQGWQLPTEGQLRKYVSRFTDFDRKLLVTMSDSSAAWASHKLPATVGGIRVRHEPWDTVRRLIRTSTRRRVRGLQQFWLDELEDYMGRATALRPYDDQWVYCVVVNDAMYGSRSFKNYVTEERVYFHPYGGRGGWPKRPVNLLAFRWGGRVRQVNRIDSYDVVADLREVWPDIVEQTAPHPHIVYRLGPDIPIPQIATAGIYANARIWVMLDQLLTHPSLREAAQASRDLERRYG